MDKTSAKTHAKRALLELREKIINGEFAGGQRLYEVALAEALDVSRTPVREAMSRLAEEGLLERASGGGFVVRSFTVADVIDAIELRGVLEGTVVRVAAERGVDDKALAPVRQTLIDLDKCFGETVEDVDFPLYSELNARFHDQLSGLAGSAILARELERAKSLPFASPSAFVPSGNEPRAFNVSLAIAQSQHRALVDAIAAREGARAESIAREHARIARGNLNYLLGQDAAGLERMPGHGLLVD
ncbi:GntR family transcriptional regulator [Pseudoprimorskyibacter insulae]|uniref:HTH-type transcriptional regulator LutR n=1 Tax=Pseudoprimorskyibacter insulae TaxID=1695997 RepID=A0A2R8AW04_9RHOB|nr:GntR family transcriptional regulator [Pseudoprimorskyibacter insulae]SPF80222.1 HTH-type transcriptional regulator LutR [Pseudoprimorskyibacter insulae]